MPIEIRELIIRATVEEDGDAASPSARASTGGAGAPPAGKAAAERARLIAECVDQVMEILREQKER
jgi:hypothetical protein